MIALLLMVVGLLAVSTSLIRAIHADPGVHAVQDAGLVGTSLEANQNPVTLTANPSDCNTGCPISTDLLPALSFTCPAEAAPCTVSVAVATVFGCQRSLTVTPLIDGTPNGPAISVDCPGTGEQPIAYTWVVGGLTRARHTATLSGSSTIFCSPDIHTCGTVTVLNSNLVVSVYGRNGRGR